MSFHARLAVLLLPLGLCASAIAQDATPDPTITRQQINSLITNAPNHRATVGTLCGAFQFSIGYGAPAWNAGDHDGCCNFYVKTGQSLAAAFGAPSAATPAAAAVLDDLKTALDRVKTSTDVDANAWTMRFVFDKAEIVAGTEVDRSAKLLELGEACMLRSQFPDAANAFHAAADSLHELDGQSVDQIPPICRYAPFALSDALFGQKNYTAAAAALEEGLRFLPDLPADMNVRQHFADPALYNLLLDDLQTAVTAHPKDAALQLLLGYHLLFSGQRDAAKATLEKALQLDPKNAGATQLLKQYDPNYHPAVTPLPIPSHISA